MGAQNNRAVTSINQQRSQRILLTVPLFVTGKRPGSGGFLERTSTIVVRAHGALLRLKEPVQVGQALTLRNVGTKEEIACTVVDINRRDGETPEIGVEFQDAVPGSGVFPFHRQPGIPNARKPNKWFSQKQFLQQQMQLSLR